MLARQDHPAFAQGAVARALPGGAQQPTFGVARAIIITVYMRICAAAILISRWITSNNKKSFFHNLILVITIPFYQCAIFQAYHEICSVEREFAALNCSGLTIAQRRAWVYIEICAFMVNIFQLMLSLCYKLKPAGGGRCCVCFGTDAESFFEGTYEDDMKQ